MKEKSGERIRLVHCIGTMRLGGAEKQLTELIARLPRERFEQSLVLMQGGGKLIEKVEKAGCPVISLGYDRKFSQRDPLSVLAMAKALGRFVSYLRKTKPDILHAQLYWANLLSVVAGKMAGVPAVLVGHRQLASLKGSSKLLMKLENFSNRHATGVLVNSEAVKRDMIAQGGFDTSKLHRIYNGVVLEDFKPADLEPLRSEFGLTPGDLVVLVVANLHRYKGHDNLLRATALIAARFPNLKIIMAGRDQGAGVFLRELIRALNLEKKACLIGERTDVPALLQLADIVAHPSLQEGFSNSILEAMAAGKPLVVSDIGGNPESVRDRENGFVVPAKNTEALAEALGRLLENPELRAKMGEASRKKVVEDFSIERTVEDYVACYEAIVARTRG